MCAYRVYQSASLQTFVDEYSSLLVPDSLFDSNLAVVVQNRSMGEWLKIRLSEKRGISADDPYVLPEKALREMAEGFPCVRELLGHEENSQSVLYLDNLKIRLYKILENLFSSPSGIPRSCHELYAYLDSFQAEDTHKTGQIRSGRLYELSDSIAGLFLHYGMNCLPLVEAWERGESYQAVPANLKKHEDWQRFLWGKVYARGLSLSRILRTVEESSESYDGPLKRIVLFGSSFLGDTALKFFYRLSQDIEVDHFILSPSKVYAQDNVSINNPLLQSWSTQMDGFASLIQELKLPVQQLEGQSQSSDSLLSSIQEDILYNLDLPVGNDKKPFPALDGSIKIHGFTSPWREVEVLKDLILDALNENPELDLTDIAVLAPNINEYAPFIEALFPDEDESLRLPYNIIDLDGADLSPLIQGFLHLFTLPGSRFNRSDLFTLFDNPCFRECFQISRQDREDWLALCEELNIRWGYDEAHKKTFFSEADDSNSWDRAFCRIKEGLFLNEEDNLDLYPFPSQDEQSSNSRSLLFQIVQNLFEDLFELDRLSMTLEQWVLLAESILESYLCPRSDRPSDESDRFRVKACFRDILNMVEETPLPAERNFDFYVFRTLLSEYIRKSSGKRGRYLTQGITCSSLKPMRAIPFQKIYILGLNENTFPGKEELLSFDLKDTTPSGIDLSRRGGDRYAFLETLLSTRETLTLFYQDRDSIRGEILQPSILVTELLDYLNAKYEFPEDQKAENLLSVSESIHSFDIRYFDGSRQSSYNRKALESASLQFSPGQPEDSGLTLSRPVMDMSALSFQDLLAFLKNPASWYFRSILGLYPEKMDSLEQNDDENHELDFLNRYSYLEGRSRHPRSLGEDSVLHDFIRDQQVRGFLPRKSILFLEEERLKSRLAEMQSQAVTRTLTEKMDGMHDILMESELYRPSSYSKRDLPQKVLPPVRINGLQLGGLLTNMVKTEKDGVWRTLEYCESGEPGFSHDFSALLKFLFLSCLDPQFKALELIRIGKREYPQIVFLCQGTPGPGKIVILDPKSRLEALCDFLINPEKNILPLYPLLGEALSLELQDDTDMDDDLLLRCWKEIWIENDAKDDGRDLFHRCPYRQAFLPQIPCVEAPLLREFLNLMYMPLRLSRKKGRKK